MAFLRFTRDKRGYEYFYLVQPSQQRGRSTARVLYWYRTPPNVKVGRAPFDEQVRRELEQQNPDVVFDWRRILETPIPSADAEKWRERRRAERAAKAARRSEPREADAEDADSAESEETALADTDDLADADNAADVGHDDNAADADHDEDDGVPEAPVHVLEAAAAVVPVGAEIPPDLSGTEPSNEGANSPAEGSEPRDASAGVRPVGSRESLRRKRRRRRHHRWPSGPSGTGGSSPAGPGGDV